MVLLTGETQYVRAPARKLSQYHNITPENIVVWSKGPIEHEFCTLEGKLLSL